MKKVAFCLLALYLIIVVLVLFFDQKPAQEIAILHVKSNRAVLLGSAEECLDVVLYLSDTDSFFTDEQNIVSVMIQDDNQLVAASVRSILLDSPPVIIDTTRYYPFTFQLVFDQVISSGGQLIFFHPHCLFTYQNEELLDIEMGDLTLSFMEISPIEHLDFTRLYGMMNTSSDRQFLNGIVIGLKKYPLGDISLESFESTLPNLLLDLSQAQIIAEPISPFTDISELLQKPYFPILSEESVLSTSLILKAEETLLFIPIFYRDLTLKTEQFPLVIHYSYAGNAYTFILDDFIYYQDHDYKLASESDVWEYLYRY
ncbi:MAG: hypothetical protein PHT56_02540 [Candidatus Izemoplasmatales bacterium]|nr:hypothetical protein [Candidatus Izemoplasmatales bacterium]MDD4988286.1 hypothetical protein [Candidatus Izemoplasmatales bacterium]